MENTLNTNSTRQALSFNLQGLPSKEELLFKSIVRLLDHRTHQSWLCYLETGSRKADLVVVTEGRKPVLDFSEYHSAQRVLTLGSAGASRDGFLCMPLHANELEAELNRVGRLVLSSRQKGEVPSAAPAVMAALPLRLLRWPSASLVATRDRIRLATLMTSQPMTLTTLQQRSGVDATVCSAFVSDLKKAGYISTLAALPASAQETIPYRQGEVRDSANTERSNRPSLISRIRTRLGIQLFGAH